MSNEDTLISMLIEETYTDSVEKESLSPTTDLRRYFEKRLNEVDYLSVIAYLEQNQLSFERLSLEDQTKCYRLVLSATTLDFPSNWSVFQHITNNDVVFLDQYNDDDFLLDIFSEIRGSFHNVAIVSEDKKVNLIFLPEESSRDHLKWIKSYFEKKLNQEEWKKAA